MSIETREKFIDGSTYMVTQMPARRAIRMKAKLIKMFGPVLASFISSVTNKNSEMNIVQAVEILANHLDENTFDTLIVDLLSGVRKNGMELTAPTIDLEFAGDMASLYHVLWFVIEVNYSNFFTMIGIGNQFFQQPTEPTATKKTYTRK